MSIMFFNHELSAILVIEIPDPPFYVLVNDLFLRDQIAKAVIFITYSGPMLVFNPEQMIVGIIAKPDLIPASGILLLRYLFFSICLQYLVSLIIIGVPDNPVPDFIIFLADTGSLFHSLSLSGNQPDESLLSLYHQSKANGCHYLARIQGADGA